MAYLGKTQLKASDIKLKAATTISGSSTNTVVLTWTAPHEQSLIFKVNGVTQNSTDFSIAGSPTTITLASGNFADGSVVEVVGINDIGTAIIPADGSVTRPKLATTGTPDGTKFLQDDMAWTTVDSLPSQTSQSGKFLTTDGSAASWAAVAAGGFNSVHHTVASSETYTVPTDVTKLLVFITGGGGSGGAGGSNYGTGGGAGTTVIAHVTVVPTDTITIAIGAGGGAQGSANNDGTAGGNSTFTHASGSGTFDTITAPGGSQGKYNAVNTGPTAGTVGSSNDGISILGGWGGQEIAGNGGVSFWGGGGQSTAPSKQQAQDATAYGAGGGGGSSTTSYHASGAGADGICFILEFK